MPDEYARTLLVSTISGLMGALGERRGEAFVQQTIDEAARRLLGIEGYDDDIVADQPIS